MALRARGNAGNYPFQALKRDLATVNGVEGFAEAYCDMIARFLHAINHFESHEFHAIKVRKNQELTKLKLFYDAVVREGHAGDGLTIATSVLAIGSFACPMLAPIAAMTAASAIGCSVASQIRGNQVEEERMALMGEEAQWLGDGPIGEFIRASNRAAKFFQKHHVSSDFSAYVVSAVLLADREQRLDRPDDHEYKVQMVRAILQVDLAEHDRNYVFLGEFIKRFVDETTGAVTATPAAMKVLLPILVSKSTCAAIAAAGVVTRMYTLRQAWTLLGEIGLLGEPSALQRVSMWMNVGRGFMVFTVVLALVAIGFAVISIVLREQQRDQFYAAVDEWSDQWDDQLDELQRMLEQEVAIADQFVAEQQQQEAFKREFDDLLRTAAAEAA